MKTHKKPTMQDVAREAGVSTATVSRVLAGFKGATTDETAERVREVAAQLGYVVNSVAASLRKERSSSVGLILADVANPFFGRLASGVEQTLSANGISVLLANSGNSVTEEERLLRLMAEKQVDAVIMASSAANGEHIRDAVARGMRIVLVDSELQDVDIDTVLIDNQLAAQKAVEHLLALGHREIAIVTGQLQASFDQERLAGYHAAFAQRGLKPPKKLTLNGDSTYEGGHSAVQALLGRPSKVTAVFATNNLMSTGAITAILEAGLRIPDDLSLIGFDDMEWYPIFKPAITAIAQPAYRLGQIAAQRLLERFAADAVLASARVILETEFIVRASTAAPRKS
ncbi:LacI family DNA-binding transcriptional regulator [Pseudomonas bohemica]|uniref:LacI family DNA-binding transcriptional regulator n=1 Tax=Pseudomonas bohemica TaxID=2044872 RepID=UPI0018FEBE91|nr:LacI family DNA-binding transcriptional regulator [Pseudomonas bohemica]